MNKEGYISKIEFIITYIVLGFVLLFQYSRSFTDEEAYLFLELFMAYVWTMGLLVYAKIQFKLHILEPITMITAIYEGIFVIKPIVDLRAHSMAEHGISVISGGAKATLLFVIGYTVFFFSYYSNHRKLTYAGRLLISQETNTECLSCNMLPFLYAAWMLTFALCIYCMLTQGLSLRYIFSFGSDGIRATDDQNTALLFLSNLGITLITLWLMIVEYSENKLIKTVITILCTVYILMRNARWLMLVFIIAPIALQCLKKNKQPRLLWVVATGTLGLAVFAWMQVNRSILASGGAMTGWGKDGFTLQKFLAPLESDLSTYRTFYSMVERYPFQYEYLLGKTFLYTVILFIPRVLWKGKPDNPVRDMIEHSLNKSARISGTAVANLGEFYANFGIMGIVFFMFLLGWIAAALKKMIFRESKESGHADIGLVMYSIMYPLFFQWIARGNFSGNFYMTIFSFLPVIMLRMIHKIYNRR